MQSEEIYLSVVIPVYNEKDSLDLLHQALLETLGRLGRPYEVILVDDGSADGSFAVLQRLCQNDERLRVIRLRRNFGQTAAFSAGFDRARGEVIVTMDADLQNDPADIPLLLKELENGYDAAVGWRKKRNDNFIRRASSKIANWIRNVISSETIKDTGCSLKAFRAAIIQPIELYEGMHRFLPTLVKMNGGRVAEVEVSHHPRAKGVSKYNVWNRILRSFLDLLAIRWMKWRKLRYHIDEQL